MVYSPFVNAGYNYADDRSGVGFGSTFPIDRTRSDVWNINAIKKFGTGSTVTLGYTGTKARIDLLAPAAVVGPDEISNFTAYDMKPFIRVDQSLLRDFNGGITKAGIDKNKAAVLSGQYLQLFRRQQILLRARTAYWTLSLAREVIAFRKVSLDRTSQILKWNERRVNLDLADKGDLYQAQAGYKLRQLNLQLAQEEELVAARNFNELIGTTGDIVAAELEKISDNISYYAHINALTAYGTRADILSARATYDSARLADKETNYRSLPELSVSGLYSLHGLDLTNSGAWNQVTGADKPTYSIGLSIIVPLDYVTLKKVRSGYKKDFESAKESLAKAELTAKNDWDQLSITWHNVKSRLSLAQEIKDVQEKRVANEQVRFERGRTTTFQLLTAEDDLDNATLNVYRLVFEEFVTFAQAELYNTRSSDLGGK
jgi:outer membrane protein TolC